MAGLSSSSPRSGGLRNPLSMLQIEIGTSPSLPFHLCFLAVIIISRFHLRHSTSSDLFDLVLLDSLWLLRDVMGEDASSKVPSSLKEVRVELAGFCGGSGCFSSDFVWRSSTGVEVSAGALVEDGEFSGSLFIGSGVSLLAALPPLFRRLFFIQQIFSTLPLGVGILDGGIFGGLSFKLVRRSLEWIMRRSALVLCWRRVLGWMRAWFCLVWDVAALFFHLDFPLLLLLDRIVSKKHLFW